MLRNKRLLKARDVEFFEINNDQDVFGYLLFIDTRRKSQLSDFPELIGIETEEDFDSNANHIKVIIFKHSNINESILESEYLFIEDMIGLKPDCSYHVSEYNTNKHLEFDMPNNMLGITHFVNDILSHIHTIVDLSKVTEQSFNHLSQN